MVYLKREGEFLDGCFGHLTVFLRIIDRELSEIQSKIESSNDPDSDGLCGSGEYLIGYGFVAMQRYIASTYPQTRKPKGHIYKYGFKLCDDLFLIEAIEVARFVWTGKSFL